VGPRILPTLIHTIQDFSFLSVIPLNEPLSWFQHLVENLGKEDLLCVEAALPADSVVFSGFATRIEERLLRSHLLPNERLRILTRLAQRRYRAGRIDEASTAVEEAIRLGREGARSGNADEAFEFAKALTLLAKVQLVLDSQVRARTSASEAVRILRNCAPLDVEVVRPELAAALNVLAVCESMLSESAAVYSLEEAIDLCGDRTRLTGDVSARQLQTNVYIQLER
jgi:hypothetical protein